MRVESMNNKITLGVIGEKIHEFSLWNRPHIYTVYFKTAQEVVCADNLDIVFLSTSVEWNTDGTYTSIQLECDVKDLKQRGVHTLLLTSILPMDLAERLLCHYFPLSLIFEKRVLGVHPLGWIHSELLHSVFLRFFDSGIEFMNLKDAVIMYLTHACSQLVTHAFQREMSQFYFGLYTKPAPFIRKSLRFDVKEEYYPVLVYMIRQIEDHRMDCPLLFSCLFRYDFLDTLL